MESDPELFKRARECKFFQGALVELADELPASDEALDELLTLAVAKRENEAFTRLLLAALGANRRVDARHLHEGGALLPDFGQLAAVSMHLSGDVASALIRAVEGGKMGNEREAMALLLAALWCKEKAEEPIPPELVAQARTLGRTYYSDFLPADSPSRFMVTSTLWALANLIREESLLAVLKMERFLDHDPFLERFKERLLHVVKDSALGLVPERPGPVVHSGFTLRRSVPRVGRNDPCPCGSGKKYKKCCIEKDKERLQESSSVPGLTKEELREQKEQYLTRDALLTMRSYELARLDPLKVSDSLKPILINRLHDFQEYETVVEMFEKIGVPEALEGHWDDAVHNVARASNRDLLERLLKIRQAQGEDLSEIELPLAAVFLRMSREPNPALELLEKTALDGIKQSEATRNFSLILDLAYCLLDNRYPALGILAARSVLPIGNVFDVEILFDSLLKARDKLNLSPVDPLQSIVDERFYESIDEHRDSEELKAALKHLKDKDRQLSTLRAEVEKLHSELESKERDMRKAAETAPPQTPAPRPSDERDRLEKLRERAASLKTELKERHEERNELRRELQSAMKALETMRRKEKRSEEPIENAADNSGRSEEHLLLAEEAFGVQPIRTPMFPKKFLESVKPLPEAVVRSAVAWIGKLAAGDETAFLGTKRLKSDRDLYRQRIGSEHRLLFRLHSDRLEVVALINRRDLERKIKSLC